MADLEQDKRQSRAGDPFINVPVRKPIKGPAPLWQRYLKTGLRGLGAVVLLAAGTVWTLRQQHPMFVKPGELLHLPPALVTAAAPGTEGYEAAPTDSAAREEISRVAFSLRKYTSDTVLARRIASAIVVQAPSGAKAVCSSHAAAST